MAFLGAGPFLAGLSWNKIKQNIDTPEAQLSMKRQQVDLETFLKGLPSEAAAKAKAAAARIDELEHAAERISRSDGTYMKLFALSGILFVVATVFMLGGMGMFINGRPHLSDFIILLMAGALPALILVYSFKMSERTKIDRQKFEIIENYFLPYDAIYLPAGPERETGVVAIAERSGGWKRRPEDDQKRRKPGWYW